MDYVLRKGDVGAEMMFELERANRAFDPMPVAIVRMADDRIVAFLAQLPANLVPLNGDPGCVACLGELSGKHARHRSPFKGH